MFWCFLCGRWWYLEHRAIAGTTVTTTRTVFVRNPVLGRSRTGVAELVDHECPECAPDAGAD